MADLRSWLYLTLADEHPMTVRQVFYRLVARGVIPKTQAEYKNTVVRLLTELRRREVVPWEWISDETRWVRKPRSYDGIEAALVETAVTYRRAVWRDQGAHVEVFVESDAIAGVVYEETAPYDVPLMVVRGYSSASFLYRIAREAAGRQRPTFFYHVGDYDPSGVDIERVIERDVRRYAGGAELHFERIAVTAAQVAAWALPGNPAKATDSRSRSFVGESVEVEAIPPADLRALVRERIERHLDRHALDVLQAAERSEREYLTMLANLQPAEEE